MTTYLLAYDAVTPENIPANASIVFGYDDGHYNNVARMAQLHPAATIIRICVDPDDDGDVLDCEKGDATPAQCPAWAQRQRARGADPTVYSAETDYPAIQAAFHAAGVAEPHYGAANWDEDPTTIPAWASYKQFHGGMTVPYDTNACRPEWVAIFKPTEEDDVNLTDVIPNNAGHPVTVEECLGDAQFFGADTNGQVKYLQSQVKTLQGTVGDLQATLNKVLTAVSK